MKPRNNNGFTLIELMIVVTIIAILAAIAFPSYNQYVIRGKRSEGRSALLDAAAREERYYSDNNVYAALATAIVATATEHNHYTLSIATSNNDQQFILTATPTSFNDADCGNLTLTNTGLKGRSGAGKTVDECWGK